MMTKILASQRYHAAHGWLKTFHLFSFANYYDPNNMGFGTLRVFNDDTIDAYSGFDEHGHEDMEIVTIVFKGQLAHRDSMGNKKTITSGEVQRMSAGTGVIHAEKNLGDEPVELYQIWLLPDQIGISPGYDQKDFSYLLEKNILSPVVSGDPRGEALKMFTGATIFLCTLEKEREIALSPGKDRGTFIYIREGSMEINGTSFQSGDQARIQQESALLLRAHTETTFVLIDVPLDELGE